MVKKKFTVAIGGSTGLRTESQNFEEFQIPVERTESDDFSGWYLGKLAILIRLSNCPMEPKNFPLRLLDEAVTIKWEKDQTLILMQLFWSSLMIFYKDLLRHIPYLMAQLHSGAPNGSVEGELGFTGDTCKILFYQGSGDVDVIRREVRNIEIGDNLTIHRTKFIAQNQLLKTQDLLMTLFLLISFKRFLIGLVLMEIQLLESC